ncbi:MAG: hypothetical protein FJ222_09640 [Lentisphaerae bacterium]|nr:hypothetical protein [Lentisphaerota bacterium]
MADGKFELGQSGNPAGRPKGIQSGRMKALGALDRITAKEANVKIMERALEKALREKPLWFFTNIVMPLLPRETRAAVEAGDRVIEWRGLMGVGSAEVGR